MHVKSSSGKMVTGRGRPLHICSRGPKFETRQSGSTIVDKSYYLVQKLQRDRDLHPDSIHVLEGCPFKNDNLGDFHPFLPAPRFRQFPSQFDLFATQSLAHPSHIHGSFLGCTSFSRWGGGAPIFFFSSYHRTITCSSKEFLNWTI